VKSVLLAAAMLVAPVAAMSATPVETHDALSTKGNRIVDHAGKPVALAGVSYFWSNSGWGQDRFYNAGSVATFAKDWNVSLVRAAMGIDGKGGYAAEPDANRARVEALVDAAIASGVYVIIDWHSHRAEKDPAAAVAFFTAMAEKYGNTPNVIYEIYNEPLRDIAWSTGVKPYSQTVIDAIRAVDPDNLIVVGSPTWSQDADIAAADPVKGSNITYTIHFYAGTHTDALRAKAKKALDRGASVFVSEWGSVNADGNGAVDYKETSKWQAFMRKHCLSQANWAVSDKKEGASLFKPGASSTGPWSDADLTDSGKLVRDVLKGWKTRCS
jgi:endoglucanase